MRLEENDIPSQAYSIPWEALYICTTVKGLQTHPPQRVALQHPCVSTCAQGSVPLRLCSRCSQASIGTFELSWSTPRHITFRLQGLASGLLNLFTFVSASCLSAPSRKEDRVSGLTIPPLLFSPSFESAHDIHSLTLGGVLVWIVWYYPACLVFCTRINSSNHYQTSDRPYY